MVAQSCSGLGNGYHVNRNNCQKYFYCINGIITNYDCSTSSAGWAKNFFCGTPEETKAIVKSSTIKSIQNPNLTWKNQCAVIGVEGWFADSSTCNRYFMCYKQNGNIAQTVMNITGMCASSEFVKSCNRGHNADIIPSNPGVLCTNKNDGYYAVINNCNKYYYCSDERAFVYNCSTALDGWAKQFFCGNVNVKSSIINSPTIRSIQFDSGVYQNQCSNKGWMSDAANCNLYFKCYESNSTLKQTKIDITDICKTSDYVQKCRKVTVTLASTTGSGSTTTTRTSVASTTIPSTTVASSTTTPNTPAPTTSDGSFF